jgi:hypothetical protein
LRLGEPVGRELPGDEVAPRDLQLLALDVPGEADDLRAVAKWLGTVSSMFA